MKGYRDISHFSFIFSDAFTIVLQSQVIMVYLLNRTRVFRSATASISREVESEMIDFGDQKTQKNEHATNERVTANS